MSSRKAGKKTVKKRAQRATSNVFAMFDQAQIQEFKEAFNMIDQNRDGFIDKDDLHDMLASLGKLLWWPFHWNSGSVADFVRHNFLYVSKSTLGRYKKTYVWKDFFFLSAFTIILLPL